MNLARISTEVGENNRLEMIHERVNKHHIIQNKNGSGGPSSQENSSSKHQHPNSSIKEASYH
jgi:hypothetical protein